MLRHFVIMLSIAHHINQCLMRIASNDKCHDLLSLQKFEEKVYSQNGEDGVLVTLLTILGVRNRYYVEFGVESGVECNTRILREHFGFDGLMMDGGNENISSNLRREFITERNVLELFAKYDVPISFDVLSLDIDMFDYWVLARILNEGSFRPRIIIVETNPTLCLNKIITMQEYAYLNSLPLSVIHPNMTDQISWDLSRYAGANPQAFRELGKLYGYEMIYCERCGINCFLVLRSEIPTECQVNIYALPLIPYPCFGTARTGGAYPGHEYDLNQRQAVRISPQLLSGVGSDNLEVSDIEAEMISCKSTGNLQSWLIDLIYDFRNQSLATDDPVMFQNYIVNTDEKMDGYIVVPIDLRFLDQKASVQQTLLKVHICSDITNIVIEICTTYRFSSGDCELVAQTLTSEMSKTKDEKVDRYCETRDN